MVYDKLFSPLVSQEVEDEKPAGEETTEEKEEGEEEAW